MSSSASIPLMFLPIITMLFSLDIVMASFNPYIDFSPPNEASPPIGTDDHAFSPPSPPMESDPPVTSPAQSSSPSQGPSTVHSPSASTPSMTPMGPVLNAPISAPTLPAEFSSSTPSAILSPPAEGPVAPLASEPSPPIYREQPPVNLPSSLSPPAALSYSAPAEAPLMDVPISSIPPQITNASAPPSQRTETPPISSTRPTVGSSTPLYESKAHVHVLGGGVLISAMTAAWTLILL